MASRFTLRSLPRERKPGANYEFDVLDERGHIVARYWFDFRGDDHGIVFNDGREVWLQMPGGDFITGGGLQPHQFTPSALAWLARELRSELGSREDAIGALVASEQRVADFFASLSSEELALREGTAWTAFEQLDHLNSAVGAVAKGFAAPKFLLRIRFGRAKQVSRSYSQLRDDYRARLAEGGRASGAFVPKPLDLAAAVIGARRDDLIERWRRRNDRLRNALGSWSEQQLDTIQLPHPLLGRITAREMLYFTIYHAEHHLVATKKRLARFSAESNA